MRYFWIHMSLFAGVWVWMLYQESPPSALSILLCAGACALFFTLFYPNVRPWLLWLFSGILFIHGLHAEQWMGTIILVLHSSMFGAYLLTNKLFYAFIITNQLFIIGLFFIAPSSDWIVVISSIVVTCMIGYTYAHIEARRDVQMMYEQLTSEYRQLRRAHIQAENDVRMKERTNIARNIHDSVGHRLTALMMRLEMLAIQRKDETFRELKQMAEESLQETRTAVHALQHEEMEGISTVVHMIQKLEAESRMFIHFTTKQGVLSMRLSPEKNIVLYRVIQEALTNAMRHAQAKVVHITLGKTAIEDVYFEIENDADPSLQVKKGFGLSQMEKRMEEIDGTISVQTLGGTFMIRGVIPQDEGGAYDVERDDR